MPSALVVGSWATEQHLLTGPIHRDFAGYQAWCQVTYPTPSNAVRSIPLLALSSIQMIYPPFREVKKHTIQGHTAGKCQEVICGTPWTWYILGATVFIG